MQVGNLKHLSLSLFMINSIFLITMAPYNLLCNPLNLNLLMQCLKIVSLYNELNAMAMCWMLYGSNVIHLCVYPVVTEANFQLPF